MRTEQADHDIFETLLRRLITELSPQTLQVIASARRLLGDRPETRLAL